MKTITALEASSKDTESNLTPMEIESLQRGDCSVETIFNNK